MRKIYRPIPALVCGGLACMQALASPPRINPAMIARGEKLSRMICAECHVVADDQKAPLRLEQSTPSFREIANRPDTTRKSLRHYVATTHWDMKTVPITMPNPELTNEQIAAVTDYILSLRAR
jgi:mono/diheme cytochrome c family protein